jgi:hypothetical protein
MKSSSILSLLLLGLVHQTVANFDIFQVPGQNPIFYYVCPGFDNQCSCISNQNGANTTTFTPPDATENILTSNFSIPNLCGIDLVDFQLTSFGQMDISVDGGGAMGVCSNGGNVPAQTCTVDGQNIDWFEKWICNGPICGDDEGYASIYSMN